MPILRVTGKTEQRLDVFLVNKMPNVNRSFIKRLCDTGKINVNDVLAKPSEKLKSGDIVFVDFDLTTLDHIPKISLPILYEDDDVIVINKPAGILTHSKGAFNPEATVATFIKDKLNHMTDERAGIVHRLDRATSGVIICAKSPAALKWLQKQFATRNVKKTYVAIVQGRPKPDAAVIEMPIERNPKHPQSFRTSSTGKEAITEYEVQTEKNDYSQLVLRPKTGRTHQLRVHLKQLGHPIVGDVLYGGEPAQRVYLHALTLELTLPNRTRKTFEAPLPNEFKAFPETK